MEMIELLSFSQDIEENEFIHSLTVNIYQSPTSLEEFISKYLQYFKKYGGYVSTVVGWFKPSLSQQKILLISRCGIVILGLISLILALILQGVISALLFAYTIYTGGVILPVLAGFYKNRLKVTPTGALVALIGGGSVALISKIFAIQYLDLGALLISGVLLFVVSLIDNQMKSKRH